MCPVVDKRVFQCKLNQETCCFIPNLQKPWCTHDMLSRSRFLPGGIQSERVVQRNYGDKHMSCGPHWLFSPFLPFTLHLKISNTLAHFIWFDPPHSRVRLVAFNISRNTYQTPTMCTVLGNRGCLALVLQKQIPKRGYEYMQFIQELKRG